LAVRLNLSSFEKIDEIVKKENAMPCDAPNVELGHHAEKCCFDSIVEKYKINDLTVPEFAKIVGAADTDKTQTVPKPQSWKQS
jgi:hypothetical protein